MSICTHAVPQVAVENVRMDTIISVFVMAYRVIAG